MRELWRRYRATLVVMGIVALVGLWPSLLAPLGRLYVLLCSRLLAEAPVGHHYPPLLVAFVAPILLVFLLAAGVIAARQLVRQRRLAAALASPRWQPDASAGPVAGSLAQARDVVFTDDLEIYAFCSGLIRPRVYLSRGVASILDAAEINALLEHELHHKRCRDPLRLFVTGLARRLARRLAPVLPVLGTFDDWMRVRVELSADRAALRSQPPEVLASAMVKFMRGAPAGAHVAGVAGLSPTEARISALLGNPVQVEVEWRDMLLSGLLLIEWTVVAAWLAFHALPSPPACSMCPAF